MLFLFVLILLLSSTTSLQSKGRFMSHPPGILITHASARRNTTTRKGAIKIICNTLTRRIYDTDRKQLKSDRGHIATIVVNGPPIVKNFASICSAVREKAVSVQWHRRGSPPPSHAASFLRLIVFRLNLLFNSVWWTRLDTQQFFYCTLNTQIERHSVERMYLRQRCSHGSRWITPF